MLTQLGVGVVGGGDDGWWWWVGVVDARCLCVVKISQIV